MAINLGVLHDAKFTYGTDIAGFIKYMDDETKTNQEVADLNFGTFMGYMDNPNKSTGLFDSTGEYISKERRKDYVQYFKLAQERDTILWQDLFSFNNEWLEEYGLMDTKTNEVDETRLMNAVKTAMDTLVKMEGLQDYKWVASMHHNTEHRHFHVAGVELNPSRLWKWHNVYKKDYRGRYVLDEVGKKIPTGNKVFQPTGVRKKETLKKIKSVFVNQLIQSAEALKAIDHVARQEIVGSIKAAKAFQVESQQEKEMLANLYLKLPKDKRLWNMKNAKKNFFGKEVTLLIESKFKGRLKEPYNDWQKKSIAQSEAYEKAYKNVEIKDAPINDPEIKKYYQDKLDKLYYDAGNAVLAQLRNLDKERQVSGMNRKKFIGSMHVPLDRELLVEVKDFSLEKIQNPPSKKGIHSELQPPTKYSPSNKKDVLKPYSQEEVDTALSNLVFKPLEIEDDFALKNPPSKKGTTNHAPYIQETIDSALSSLVYKEEETKQSANFENLSSQKGQSSNPWHVVNVYLDDEKIRVLTNSEVDRKEVQTLYEEREKPHKKYGDKNTNYSTTGKREVEWDRRKFIEERQNAAKINRTIRGIDRNMKKATNKWRDQMDYEYLEQQILQEGKHSFSY
ncbi:MobP2 family relaxase [Listeria monocytogenes]